MWNPFEEAKRIKKDMDKVFGTFEKKGASLIKRRTSRPLVDIKDKKNSLEIHADLPGIDQKDIKVKITEDKIEIKAQHDLKEEIKKKDFYKKERSYHGFYRLFSLPAKVKSKTVKKSFKNGVLKITVEKK